MNAGVVHVMISNVQQGLCCSALGYIHVVGMSSLWLYTLVVPCGNYLLADQCQGPSFRFPYSVLLAAE